MNVAIFGGSFDPVHIAHEAIVKKAINLLDIDRLIVVPTYLNPFKSNYHFEPNVRLKLLKKVFSNLKNVQVCDYEINQQRPVYSIETIKHLKEFYNLNKIYLIIGQDNLKSLHKWYKIDELKELVEFVIARRNGYEVKEHNYKTIDLDINISSTTLRESLNMAYIPLSIKDDILSLQNEKGLCS